MGDDLRRSAGEAEADGLHVRAARRDVGSEARPDQLGTAGRAGEGGGPAAEAGERSGEQRGLVFVRDPDGSYRRVPQPFVSIYDVVVAVRDDGSHVSQRPYIFGDV